MRRHSINQVHSSTPLIFFVRRDLSYVADTFQLDEPVSNWSLQNYENPLPFESLLEKKITNFDSIDNNQADIQEDIYDLDLMPFKPKEKEFIVKGFIIEPFLPKAQVEELLCYEI
jgi:hypothetical protein